MSDQIMTSSGQMYSKKVSLLSQQGSNVKVKVKKKNGKPPSATSQDSFVFCQIPPVDTIPTSTAIAKPTSGVDEPRPSVISRPATYTP